MEETKRDFKLYILVFKSVFFALIILAAYIIKMLSLNLFFNIKKEYIAHFEQQTKLEEIFKPVPSYSDFNEGYSFYSE